MVVFVLVVVFVVIMTLVAESDAYSNDYITAGLLSLIFGAILGGILSFSLGKVVRVADFNEVKSYNLITLGDSLAIEGEYPLTIQYSTSKMKLAYYRHDGNGSIQRVMISKDLATIHRSDTVTTPRIDVHIKTFKGFSDTWVWSARNIGEQRYDIYLPTGTKVPSVLEVQ